ncbi:MAG: DUF6382 domain-containing protein [Eubacteriaceae bacterium]|nr:DUF6382 domain-containing protein [Eubacteriaceae bacterium]
MNVDLRENDYMLEMEAGSFLDFEEKVLVSGLCDFALPMDFFYAGENVRATYMCSGYTSVADLKLSGAKEYFEILEKTLLTLKKAGEFLIDREKVTVAMSTVYFHRKYRDVKFAYIPESERCTEKKVAEFIGEMEKYASGKAKEYLDRVRTAVIYENLDLADTINLVGRIRQEIHECGIE